MMEKCRHAYRALAIILLLAAGVADEARAVEVGSTEGSVEMELGAPRNTIRSGNKTMLLYGGGTVEVVGGKVTAINGTPQPHQDKRPVRVGGATPDTAAAKPEAAKEGKPQPGGGAADVKDYRDGGKVVDLPQLLVSGKTTVVVFYADWCPSCRKAMPLLDKLAAEDTAIALRKVNIDSWDTPVAKKYGVSSIPNMRVFDQQGKQLGEPASNIERVRKLVETAKKD